MTSTVVLSFISAVLLIGAVHAEDNVLKGLKLGFGYDRDFGIGVRYQF